MKIKLSQIEEPGARLYLLGGNVLTEAENLSIIIAGKDSLDKAKRIMAKVNYSYADLARLTYHDLAEEGLSHTQSLHVLACNNYAHRKASQIADTKDRIARSSDAADIFFPLIADLNYEEFWVLYLNRANYILAKEKISQGGETGTVTDLKIILRKAIGYHAQGIILAHNHPSGHLQPSESDKVLTKKIKDAATLMDLQILDHLIIAGKEHYSFADDGQL